MRLVATMVVMAGRTLGVMIAAQGAVVEALIVMVAVPRVVATEETIGTALDLAPEAVTIGAGVIDPDHLPVSCSCAVRCGRRIDGVRLATRRTSPKDHLLMLLPLVLVLVLVVLRVWWLRITQTRTVTSLPNLLLRRTRRASPRRSASAVPVLRVARRISHVPGRRAALGLALGPLARDLDPRRLRHRAVAVPLPGRMSCI